MNIGKKMTYFVLFLSHARRGAERPGVVLQTLATRCGW